MQRREFLTLLGIGGVTATFWPPKPAALGSNPSRSAKELEAKIVYVDWDGKKVEQNPWWVFSPKGRDKWALSCWKGEGRGMGASFTIRTRYFKTKREAMVASRRIKLRK